MAYKEKTFLKNTDIIKTRISLISEKVYKIPGGRISGIGNILSSVAKLADLYDYPQKADSKSMKAIDERILHVLDLMTRSVQQQNLPSLSEYSKMLLEAFEDARQYGKERYSEDYLKHGEIKAEALGEMLNSINQKKELQEKILNIKAEARAARDSGDMAELQRIDLMYQNCNREMESAEESFQDWKRNYDQAIEILSEQREEERLNRLNEADLMSAEAYAKKVASNTKILEEHAEKAVRIAEIAKEAKQERSKIRGGAQKAETSVIDVINNEDLVNSHEHGTTVVGNGDTKITVSKGLFDE